jgi:hypothetical protein
MVVLASRYRQHRWPNADRIADFLDRAEVLLRDEMERTCRFA